MKTCANKCGRLGISLRCPLCGERTCRTEACVDEHAAMHLRKLGCTEQEAVEAMADPLGSDAEERTLDRIHKQIQAREKLS